MDMYERMALFGHLDSKQKEHLLLATLYNDIRLFEDSPTARRATIKGLFSDEKQSIVGKFRNYRIDLPINEDNWREQIIAVSSQLALFPGSKPLDRSFVLNAWLVKSGLCPLVRFAFDQWHECGPTLKDVDALADLSTTFLYRLIDVPEPLTTNTKLGGGAYSNVYLSDDGASVYKVPKNMASMRFASHDEYLASQYAEQSALAPFLPRTLNYTAETGIIQREFIRGKTGFEMLRDKRDASTLVHLEQIEEIHQVACDIYQKDGINFDIHSGNMMWSAPHQRWLLVDIGPMPKIGAEYFPRGNFKEYFQKIWLDVYGLMVDVPIRSLDIKIPNPKMKLPTPVKRLFL